MRLFETKIIPRSLRAALLVCMASTLYAENIYTTFTIQSDRSANLAFTMTGIVQSVEVEVADPIKKGEKLAELENSDLRSALAVAEANLNSTKVALKFAKRAYDRESKVKKLISETQHDQVILAYESAKTKIALMEANRAYQQALLDKTILYAPFDGVIYSKEIEVGDAVSGAMIRTVFRVHDIGKVKLVLEVDQKYWKLLKVGQTFRYQVDGDETKYEGEISKIYPYADSSNRKIKAEVEAKGFIVGLFGSGHIVIPDTDRPLDK
ncbi:MAG: efflux RND transporter periplasmic adaptor subunit [Campylobacterota bacterium]|nr:efflux RND transporter periplasmic adaptor subunit [Campylobacterota bacterium]